MTFLQRAPAPRRALLAIVSGAAALGAAAGSLSIAPVARAADPGTPPAGTLTMMPQSGDSTTSFELDAVGGNSADEGNSYCPGDAATDGYRWQTYITPAAVDPATLTYDSNGPIVPAAQSSLQAQTWALLDPIGSAYVGRNPEVNPKGFFDLAGLPVAFTVFPNDLFPTGDYMLGVACSKAGITETYWTLRVTLTADLVNGYTIAPPAATAPAAPVVEDPTPGDGTLEIEFAVTPAPTPPITSYEITAVPTGGGAPITQTVTASPATITGLTNGTEYSITVTATNTSGTSEPSNAVVGTPNAVIVPPDSSSSSSSSSSSPSIPPPPSSSSSVAPSSSSSTVTPPSASSTSSTAAGGTLPRTGGGSAWPIAIVALLALVFGRMAVLLGRTPKTLPPRQ